MPDRELQRRDCEGILYGIPSKVWLSQRVSFISTAVRLLILLSSEFDRGLPLSAVDL